MKQIYALGYLWGISGTLPENPHRYSNKPNSRYQTWLSGYLAGRDCRWHQR